MLGDTPRWSRVKQLFQDALERSVDERPSFLRGACADDAALRAEVESLLLAHADAGPFAQWASIDALRLGGDDESPIGRRLGTYVISDRLGVGGMGEVYRARDTTLGRDVAIKVLPREVTDDSNRLARFEREARTLAALNHPHICAIYGVEDWDGTRALVLELVEGETLAARLQRGPTPRDTGHPLSGGVSSSGVRRVNEALSLARQIATALEAAHERGIVHRDLKPANIKITPDGVLKVLDFGLAKAGAGTAGVEETSAENELAHLSGDGVILGTPAYMSPEQARGLAVDKRTDIWAFGCVLYEMLTGLTAFRGRTTADTIAAVLERTPDWTALPPETPATIRSLLRQCLEKEPKQRLRDVGDAGLGIELALAETAGAQAAPSPLRRGWLPVAAVVVAVASVAIVATRDRHESAAPVGPEMRLEITPPLRSLPLEFALAPDSRHIVFVASPDGPQRLWLRALNETEAKPLGGTEGADYPFWSADGRSLGFFASGKLYRVDISGGPPQPLADAPMGYGGAWNAAGTIVFAPTYGALVRLPASGGKPVAVTRLDPPRQAGHMFPQFLPDGRHFLFYAGGTVEHSGVYLASLDGGAPKRLTAADTAAAYLSPDLLVFALQGSLVARHFDRSRAELTGDVMTLAEAISADTGFRLGGFSVSADGRVAYGSPRAFPAEASWFDRSGKRLTTVVGDADQSTHLANPELSRDGAHLAVTRAVQNNVDVWVSDLVRGGLRRLTVDPNADAFALWSPDGTQIAFSSNRSGVARLYLKPSNGGGTEEVLHAAGMPQDWSRDGRFLLYGDTSPETARDIWVMDMTSSERGTRPVAQTRFEERNGQFSPDGHWIAFETNESGRFEVVVRAFSDASAGSVQVSRTGGTQPRWRSDGREIYFLAPGGRMMAAPVSAARAPSSPLQIGAPVSLFSTRIGDGGATVFKAQYAVSHDGHFLISQPVDASAAASITLLLNWRAPTH